MKRLKIGLHGTNGHQIQGLLAENQRATLAAVSAWGKDIPQGASPKRYDTLEELLRDPEVELVSLCSPRRKDQARDAIACLEAGRHVYAEKPCALTEKELDAIVEASCRTGRRFHEMAGTAFAQPYLSMRRIVADGIIGDVIQILVQKSYPSGDWRPLDEDVDGGLLLQVGIHAARMVEHVAGARIASASAVQTRLGNPRGGDLRMAAAIMIGLEGGGVATITCNYLNPRGFPSWGNETLRIFGTKGMVEAVDGGARTRLVCGDKDEGSLCLDEPSMEYFEMFLDELLGIHPMPLSLEEELHPLRALIRARAGIVDLT